MDSDEYDEDDFDEDASEPEDECEVSGSCTRMASDEDVPIKRSARGPRKRGGASKDEATRSEPLKEEAPLRLMSVMSSNDALGVKADDTRSSLNSGGSCSRRPVRGRIGLGSERSPPGTSESVNRAVASNKPIWLQAGAAQPPGPPQPAKEDATPLWLQPSQRQPSPAADVPLWLQGGASKPPSRGPAGELGSRDEMASRGGRDLASRGDDGAGDSDRRVQRLQQQIKRLEARLRETDIYSAADEGLPVFVLEDLELGIQIGSGGFCSVHEATWRSTPVAVKKIFDPVITEELRSEFENEVRMLARMRHPNIVILMAVCRVPPALSILTELLTGGSFFELLHGPPSLRAKRGIDCEPYSVLPIIHQAGCALAFLHLMLVAHRDIKSHNVLLTSHSKPTAKLCDFGLARMKSELCTGSMQYAGTAAYMAPELFAKKKYDECVDVFAFGVMVWESISQEIPHANLDPQEIYSRVQKKDGAGLALVHAWPKSLKELLRDSLAVQPEKRPKMVDVVAKVQQISLDFPPEDR